MLIALSLLLVFLKIAFIFASILLVLCCFSYSYLDTIMFTRSVNGFLLFVLCIFFLKINVFFILDDTQTVSLRQMEGLYTKVFSDTIFHLNFLSVVFIITVMAVGILTLVFTHSYMKQEKHEQQFSLLLVLFIFSMLLFLASGSFYMLLLGWELIGLISFLLINFWHTRKLTLNCAFKAFIFNKFSDICLIIFLLFLLNCTNTGDISLSMEYVSLMTIQEGIEEHSVYFILYGSFVKSAQLLLHLWLVDSMEAPVPASALIHSATLVTSGVFLLIIFFPAIELFNLEVYLLTVGSVTACVLGFSSALQTDIKKLLAYSTISNCGFMVVCCSLNNLTLILVFMCLHGVFKAGLFFFAGYFVKYYSTQDIRLMGQFIQKDRSYFMLFILCTLNLVGAPLTIGYLAKSLFIAEISASSGIWFGFIFLAMGSSLVYSYRLIYSIGIDTSRHFFEKYKAKLQLTKLGGLVNHYTVTSTINYVLAFLVMCTASIFYLYFDSWLLNSYLTYSLDNRVIDELTGDLWFDDNAFNVELGLFSCLLLSLLFECLYVYWSNQKFKYTLVSFNYWVVYFYIVNNSFYLFGLV